MEHHDASQHDKGHPVLEMIHQQHPAIETADAIHNYTDAGKASLRMMAGSRAFREYHPFLNVIGLNQSGNLRGMVVSAKWRTLFRHVEEVDKTGVGKAFDGLGYFVSVASELAESAPKIDKIMDSSESMTIKGLKLTATAGTIAERVLAGAVSSGVHMIYKSVSGYCMMAGLAGFDKSSQQCLQTINNADTLVQTTFKQLTDTENQAKAFWWVVDFATRSKR